MRTFVAAVMAAAILAARLGAQDPQTVTEAEFLAPLDPAHPALVASSGDLAAAEAAALATRALQNPELGITREAPGESEQVELTLSWQPPDPGRRRLTAAAADADVVAARARLDFDRTALRQSLREAFARWAVATATTAELAVQAARVDALARREGERAAAGETSGLDARRLALAAGETRIELARAEAERKAAGGLARAWRPDLPPDAVPEVPALPGATPAPTDDHPRLAALRAELEAARLNERLAARVFEMPALVGGWQRQDGTDDAVEGPILGVAWPVPLLDRRRGARAAARARVETLQARLTLAEREIAWRRSSSLLRYEALRDAALAAQQTAEDAPAIVTAATAAFQAGEAELTDLLDALRSATAAELAALELQAEALAAQRELSSLSPALDPIDPKSAPAAPFTASMAPTHSVPGDTP